MKEGVAMELMLMCIIAWLTVAVFTFLPRKMSIAANILTYMMLAVVDINKISFLAFNFQYIEISSDTIRFISFLVYRDIIFSFLLLIAVNIWFAYKHKIVRFISVVCTLVLIYILREILAYFSIFSYRHVSYLFELLLDVVLLFITIVIAYVSHKITEGMNASEKHRV